MTSLADLNIFVLAVRCFWFARLFLLAPSSSTLILPAITMEKVKAPVLPVIDPYAPAGTSSRRKVTLKRGVLTTASVLTLFVLAHSTNLYTFNISGCMHETRVAKTELPDLGVPKNIQRHWGQYSPYYPAGKYVEPPSGCVIDQVNIVRVRFLAFMDRSYVRVMRSCNDTVLVILIATTTMAKL